MVDKLFFVLVILNLLPGDLLFSSTPDSAGTTWGVPKLVTKLLGCIRRLSAIAMGYIDMTSEATGVAGNVIM